MSINSNNALLNEILETINNLPNSGVGGGIEYTNITYNDDNTVTLTDKDGVDHIMVCEYEDGSLTALTYDGKSIALTYEEDALVGIGATEVDVVNVPYESGGDDTEEIESLIDASGVLESTEGTATEKVEQLIDKSNQANMWYDNLNSYSFIGYRGSKFPRLNMETLNSMQSFSSFCTGAKIESIDFYINGNNPTTYRQAFYGTSSLKTMKGCNTSNATDLYWFLHQSAVEEIEMPFNLSKVTNVNSAFATATNLKRILFDKETIKRSISFNGCTKLIAESVQSIFDGLDPTVTGQTLTLPKAFNNADAEAVVSANIEVVDGVTRIKGKEGWTLVR